MRKVALVLTYNRLALLKECIKGIEAQEEKLDKLYIVNNSSTDGTKEYLKEKVFKIETEVINNDINSGGAGGFRLGMNYIQQKDKGLDYLWIMDDDVVPDKECLKEMLKYRHVSECIHPTRYSYEGVEYKWHYLYDMPSGRRVDLSESKVHVSNDIYFTNVGCFEGMLVSRRILEEVEKPKANYFICEDDTLYGYLASFITPVMVTKKAKLYKKELSPKSTRLKEYYALRNIVLLRKDAYKLTWMSPTLVSNIIFAMILVTTTLRKILRSPNYAYTYINAICDGLRGK